ncbi:MAG TPA: NAD-dependent epimerase/dehydratase family protein, partial [Myxococcaceae bacterium]
VERFLGDRDGELGSLGGREFDAVLDTCGYVPRVVRDSARLLADSTNRYLFVSSESVYADMSGPGQDENAPLATMEDPADETVTDDSYGPLKVLCENEVAAALPGRALIVRPGYIVGPNDPTDRFTWWVRRSTSGGEMLAPGPPDLLMRFIDVRDLGSWMLSLLERSVTGVFNADGPGEPVTANGLVSTARSLTGTDTRVTWIDHEFLLEAGLRPDSAEMPLWLPGPEWAARFDATRAVESGLTYRPVEDTVGDTLAWDRSRGGSLKTGLSPQREAELLASWRSR